MAPIARRGAMLATGLGVVTAPATAWAHDAVGAGSGFLTGFAHPITGPDHVAAMVAVGLLGAMLGPPAVYLLPILFPLVMAIGGALGVAAVPLPGVEVAIAASAIALGLMVASGRQIPLAAAAAVVALFAIFHGHAHGTELPAATDALAYALGFVVGTGLLHLIGIMFGIPARWSAGRAMVRALGGAIAVAGVTFLAGAA